jgi:hypothetical protein
MIPDGSFENPKQFCERFAQRYDTSGRRLIRERLAAVRVMRNRLSMGGGDSPGRGAECNRGVAGALTGAAKVAARDANIRARALHA